MVDSPSTPTNIDRVDKQKQVLIPKLASSTTKSMTTSVAESGEETRSEMGKVC